MEDHILGVGAACLTLYGADRLGADPWAWILFGIGLLAMYGCSCGVDSHRRTHQ